MVVPLALLGSAGITVVAHYLRAEIRAGNADLTVATIERLRDSLDHAGSLTLEMAHAFSVFDPSGDDAERYLRSFEEAATSIRQVLVLDARGTVIYAEPNGDHLVGNDMSYQPFYSDRSGETPGWTQILRSPGTGDASIAIHCTVGGRRYVSFVDLGSTRFPVGDSSRSRESVILLLDHGGTVIHHPDPEAVRQRKAYGHLDPFVLAIAHSEVTGVFDIDSRKYLLSARRMEETGWVMMVGQPIESATRPIFQIASVLVLSFVLAIGIAFVNTMLGMRFILGPINELAERMRSVEGGGDAPDRRAEPYREIAMLTDRFDAMVRAVKDRERRLRRLVDEKSVLIREIHHRVKNNMQVVSSLLSLQAERVSDRSDADLFRASRERVHSMAIVHEMLYRSESLSSVAMDQYIPELVSSIEQSHRSSERDIRVNLHVDAGVLDITLAVPCGLILNELIVNAFQHAFGPRESGSITVRFESRRTFYALEVADTGRGLPGDAAGNGLGMVLVETLARQLSGTVHTRSSGGTTVSITFPC